MRSPKPTLLTGQNKGALCACGCSSRKTSRKMKFFPGHNETRRDTRWNSDLKDKPRTSDRATCTPITVRIGA